MSVKHLGRYVHEFSFRLNEGNVARKTVDRLDSFIGNPELTWAPVEELNEALDDRAALRQALTTIAEWKDFPPSNATYSDGTKMSFAAAFGANGERDHMRGVAQAALNTIPRGFYRRGR